jgi:hypothetical protein
MKKNLFNAKTLGSYSNSSTSRRKSCGFAALFAESCAFPKAPHVCGYAAFFVSRSAAQPQDI